MFLGLDKTANSVYFLTNRKLANLENDFTDASEARFSSPPVVKMISFDQIKTLKTLQEQVIGTQRDLSEDLSQSENEGDPQEKIRALMDSLPCWDVCGDEKSIDFYRTFTMDYPYCEGYLHPDLAKITLLFSGMETRESVALTFSLAQQAKNQDESEKREEQVLNFEGWFLDEGKDEQVELLLDAGFNDDEKMSIKCSAKRTDNGEEYQTSYLEEETQWNNVEFDYYKPFCPFKLKSLRFSKSNFIQEGKGTITARATNFALKLAPGFYVSSEEDKEGYAGEKRLDLVCEGVKSGDRSVKATMRGYCVHSPFKTKLYLVYQEPVQPNGARVQRRLILEKSVKAMLTFQPTAQQDGTETTQTENFSFSVTVEKN